MDTRRLRKLRRKISRQQRDKCYYCGVTMVYHKDAYRDPIRKDAATIEHLVPKYLGGRGGNNLVVACWLCNSTRGACNQELSLLFLGPEAVFGEGNVERH